LYDLLVETGSPQVKQLLQDGITGLKTWLPEWDYRGKWSWYGDQEYLCSPAYHCLNRLLLEVLGDLTGDEVLARLAQQWNPARLSGIERMEIYIKYNWTQTLVRFRNKSWRLQPSAQPVRLPDARLIKS
jgi:hypothetical protein